MTPMSIGQYSNMIPLSNVEFKGLSEFAIKNSHKSSEVLFNGMERQNKFFAENLIPTINEK